MTGCARRHSTQMVSEKREMTMSAPKYADFTFLPNEKDKQQTEITAFHYDVSTLEADINDDCAR
eukprot:scaffold4481_cov121-Cylindrotheca_fusiformis.AAC.21